MSASNRLCRHTTGKLCREIFPTLVSKTPLPSIVFIFLYTSSELSGCTLRLGNYQMKGFALAEMNAIHLSKLRQRPMTVDTKPTLVFLKPYFVVFHKYLLLNPAYVPTLQMFNIQSLHKSLEPPNGPAFSVKCCMLLPSFCSADSSFIPKAPKCEKGSKHPRRPQPSRTKKKKRLRLVGALHAQQLLLHALPRSN